MKHLLISLSMCVIATATAYSQLDKPLRAEIVIPTSTYPFAVINLENKGVMVHTALGESNKNFQNNTQSFFFYDIYLRQKWQLRTHFPNEYAVVNHTIDHERGSLHIILRNQVYRNTLTPTFLMNIELSSGEFVIDTLYSFSKTPTLAGFTYRERVWLVQYDRFECAVNIAKPGDSIVYKYAFQKFSTQEIIDAELDTITQHLHVLHGEESRREDFFTLVVLDTLANVIATRTIPLNAESRPVQAKLRFDKHGKLFICGTYNLSSERQRGEANSRLSESAGFFSITSDGALQMQNYADFDSIDQNISPDQSQILRQKRGRRQQPFSMDIFAFFQARTIGENLLLVGESINGEYRTLTQTYYDYYGRVVPYTSTVFEGFRYNDAFIWLLDSTGKARRNYISDISMTIKTKTLIPKTAYSIGQNEVVIMFVNATNVFYKSLQPYEKTFSTLKLQPLQRGDKIIDDYDSRVFNWYGSHFLVCGYQTVQNNTLKGANKRVVFYLSKISLD